MAEKPYAFRFWQAPGSGTPDYIRLCLETQDKVLCDRFRLVLLDWDSCADWIDDRDYLWSLSEPRTEGRSFDPTARRLALFSDLLRLRLISRHGGLWLDGDTLALPDLARLAAPLSRFDFVGGLGSDGRVINGIFGARPSSDFMARCTKELDRRLTEAERSGDRTAVWGGYGSGLLAAQIAKSDPDDLLVLPLGSLIQHRKNAHLDLFDSATDWDGLVSSETLAISLYNNAIPAGPRALSAAQLVAGDTPFARAHSRAMSGDAPSSRPLSTLNQAAAIVELTRKHARRCSEAGELRQKLDDRNAKVAKMRDVREAMAGKLEAAQKRIQSLRTANAELRRLTAEHLGSGERSRKAVFSEIYDKRVWYMGGSHSGCGSSLRQTETLRERLIPLLRKHSIASLLDIPCGDFNWMQHVDLGEITYIGADIVPELIARNARHSSDRISFQVCDLVSDPLPRADCVMVRDCFSHLSLGDCRKGLANIRASGARFTLITHFTAEGANSDITTGNFRRLNFCLAPFELPPPVELLDEGHPNPRHADKTLGLWRIADLSPGG